MIISLMATKKVKKHLQVFHTAKNLDKMIAAVDYFDAATVSVFLNSYYLQIYCERFWTYISRGWGYGCRLLNETLYMYKYES